MLHVTVYCSGASPFTFYCPSETNKERPINLIAGKLGFLHCFESPQALDQCFANLIFNIVPITFDKRGKYFILKPQRIRAFFPRLLRACRPLLCQLTLWKS